MSLINKMLQDLEQRHAEEGAGNLPPAVRATPAPQRGTPWLLIGALCAILLCMLAAWIWLRPIAVKPAPAAPAPVLAPMAQAVQPAASSPAPLPSLALKVDGDLSISSIAQIPSVEAASTAPSPAVQDIKESAAPVMQSREPQADTRHRSEPLQDKPAQSKSESASKATRPESRSVPDVAVKNIANEQPLTLNKQVKDWTPQQKAENDFRKATTLIQQGRAQEASPLLEQALQTDPSNVAARQTLIALMVNAKRRDDAMRLAQQGLELDARQTNFAMILARLQLDKGEQKAAITTLQRSLPAASNNAEYQAFLAALMQREGRHAEAIDLYEAALDKAPQNGVWWMGLGISLQADNRPQPAREAFIHARETASLSPDLQAFIEQKIRQLSR